MKRRMIRLAEDQSGAALVLVLAVLTVLTVFSMAAVMTATQGLRISASYKTEQQTLYASDSGADYSAQMIARALSNHNIISATDSSSSNVTLNTTDSDGDGITDLEATIGGSKTYNADTLTGGNPDVQLDFIGDSVNIDVDFLRSRLLPGASSEFASRYEGIGSGTSGGVALDYQVDAKNERRGTAVTVRAIYKCVEGGGRCI